VALCFISIGSNINREQNVVSALGALQREFGSLLNSSLYESTSVGFEGAAFFNLVTAFNSEESVIEIVLCLKKIEAEHGRERGKEKFSSRSLDLDLLLYDQTIMQTTAVTLPHADILAYAFVLEPLAEIAAEHEHPVEQRNYADLWEDFAVNVDAQQKKVPFPLTDEL
jgi:2-amino-4-hydroxy-6-hydroxymethyldihydropteridine diphosphokinase